MAAQEDSHNSLFDHSGNQAQGYYLLLKANKTTSTLPNVGSMRDVKATTFLNHLPCRPMLPVNTAVQR